MRSGTSRARSPSEHQVAAAASAVPHVPAVRPGVSVRRLPPDEGAGQDGRAGERRPVEPGAPSNVASSNRTLPRNSAEPNAAPSRKHAAANTTWSWNTVRLKSATSRKFVPTKKRRGRGRWPC